MGIIELYAMFYINKVVVIHIDDKNILYYINRYKSYFISWF